jgi:hypothetical protein
MLASFVLPDPTTQPRDGDGVAEALRHTRSLRRAEHLERRPSMLITAAVVHSDSSTSGAQM